MHECKTVTLRTRPLKKNMLSFYLDYYPGYRDKESMKVIRHESLGIYIYAEPKNQREQNFNAVMSEKAEAIRCRRFESIVNERYDFFDKSKMKGDFLAYYKKTLRKHDQKWEFVYLHFSISWVENVHSRKSMWTYATSSESICLMRSNLDVLNVPYHAIRLWATGPHSEDFSKYSIATS